MSTAQSRFAVFVLIVLAGPAAVILLGGPALAGPGKLVLIFGPALAGWALNRGLGDRGHRADWRGVGLAGLVTLGLSATALVAAYLGGAVALSTAMPPSAGVAAVGGTLLTSVLEELGWAGGGLGLATAAFGRRWGVAILGVVWACWHLIPAHLNIGMFAVLATAPLVLTLSFIVCCVVFRELLTQLRERAQTWWAAAAGHAVPNMFLAGMTALGLTGLDRPHPWWLLPAPGGLVFLGLATAAAVALSRRT